MAFLRALVPPAPAGCAGASMRRTPFCYILRLVESAPYRAIFQAPRSLRSCNPLWLGEERVRGLVHGFLVFCLLASYAAAETPASAVEKISDIIQAEIMAMPEWKDADIRIEITGGVKNAEIFEPGESFRLAQKGLTVGRRSVFAPIEVIRDGKTVRSMSVPAVVYLRTEAVTAARKIASGETIMEPDIQVSTVETTDIGVVFLRDPKKIEGKIARRAFAAGDMLPLEAFSEPLLVRRGDKVNLRLERGGIMLTSSARAEENGRLGEIIRVKNDDFSSVIRARVTGQSEVLVQ